jgi:hypothetical protein
MDRGRTRLTDIGKEYRSPRYQNAGRRYFASSPRFSILRHDPWRETPRTPQEEVIGEPLTRRRIMR